MNRREFSLLIYCGQLVFKKKEKDLLHLGLGRKKPVNLWPHFLPQHMTPTTECMPNRPSPRLHFNWEYFQKNLKRHGQHVEPITVTPSLDFLLLFVLFFSRLMLFSTCNTLCKECSSKPNMLLQLRTINANRSSTNWWPGMSLSGSTESAAGHLIKLFMEDMSQWEKHRCKHTPNGMPEETQSKMLKQGKTTSCIFFSCVVNTQGRVQYIQLLFHELDSLQNSTFYKFIGVMGSVL